ncbi:MAG: hypothetical protein KGQ66_04775 [Acidobacteriota bacterium]|nr:hypothetical protein [Acidobacteriota bacterium]
MSDVSDEQSDPVVDQLVAVMQKDEDDRSDADWELLGNASEEQVQAAADRAGVSFE